MNQSFLSCLQVTDLFASDCHVTSVTNFLFVILHIKPLQSEMGSSLKEKNLLPMGANSLLLEQTSFQMGAETS